ncbi:transglycosylase SLT domain-containing protein [Nocardia sp. NPDC004168]|uniref:transglycosylase SLT domain-containing protein n=1 Tax=Nocardia sp. NPDC004168 TaxID=3154452 RepID=UPI0033B51FFF
MKLDPPYGATHGLRAIIERAQETIQTSADLLAPAPVPHLSKLLRYERLEPEYESKSVMVDSYVDHLKEFNAFKDDLRKQDANVDSSAYGTYDIASSTFAAVKQHVQTLQATLAAAPPPAPGERFLSPDVESRLAAAVLQTVDDVHNEIQKATGGVQTHARNIDGSAPTYIPASAGGRYVPDDYPQRSYSPGPGFVPAAITADYARYQGNVSVDAAIDGALDALGITDPVAREYWKRGYRVLIERESGGNPNAVNNWDSNAAAGHASRGLTQTIPGTFQAYHVGGTSNNINDPVANVAASMNYVMERYDVSRDGHDLQAKVQQADPNRSPKGY